MAGVHSRLHEGGSRMSLEGAVERIRGLAATAEMKRMRCNVEKATRGEDMYAGEKVGLHLALDILRQEGVIE